MTQDWIASAGQPLRGTLDIPGDKSVSHRAVMFAALADGTLDAICSDHTPVGADDKLLPFGEAEPGATALETLLPLVLKWAHEARVPLVQALSRVTSAPARILAEDTGRLEVGGKADIVILDPQAHWTVGESTLVSSGKNTPFSGYELEGRARCTIVGGDLRHDTLAAR